MILPGESVSTLHYNVSVIAGMTTDSFVEGMAGRIRSKQRRVEVCHQQSVHHQDDAGGL